MDTGRSEITDKLDAAKNLMEPIGTRNAAPFGWVNPDDEIAFLVSLQDLVGELRVQLTARGATRDTLADARAEVDRQLAVLQSPNPDCSCSHPLQKHTTSGCWAEDQSVPGGTACTCSHRSGLAVTEVRGSLNL